jgi:hypothetical protein
LWASNLKLPHPHLFLYLKKFNTTVYTEKNNVTDETSINLSCIGMEQFHWNATESSFIVMPHTERSLIVSQLVYLLGMSCAKGVARNVDSCRDANSVWTALMVVS